MIRTSAFRPYADDKLVSLLQGQQQNDYTTGHQRAWHIDDLIATAVARRDPGRCVDVGCNDGTLLGHLKRWGYQAIGIEPNKQAADIASARGHVVLRHRLSPWLAEQVLETGPVSTVYCRHVLEHVAVIDQFFNALDVMMAPSAQLVLEMPDVEAGIAQGNPAVLWREHLHYFAASEVEQLLVERGYRITDRRQYAFGGGSLAWVAERDDFVSRMTTLTQALRTLVVTARERGWSVVLYGAAPRSESVVLAANIEFLLDRVVDDRADRFWIGNSVTRFESAGLSGNVLCLMGVGCENEWRIRRKIEPTVERLVCVSLLPPRDVLASIAAAMAAVSPVFTHES